MLKAGEKIAVTYDYYGCYHGAYLVLKDISNKVVADTYNSLEEKEESSYETDVINQLEKDGYLLDLNLEYFPVGFKYDENDGSVVIGFKEEEDE